MNFFYDESCNRTQSTAPSFEIPHWKRMNGVCTTWDVQEHRYTDHVKVKNKKSRIKREMGEPCSKCVRTRCIFFSVDISVTTRRLSLLLRSSSSPNESHLRYLWQFKRKRQMDKSGWFYCLPSVLCAESAIFFICSILFRFSSSSSLMLLLTFRTRRANSIFRRSAKTVPILCAAEDWYASVKQRKGREKGLEAKMWHEKTKHAPDWAEQK